MIMMSKRVAAAILACMLLLPLASWSSSPAAGDSCGAVARDKTLSAGRGDYDDEFNGNSLDPKWDWFNPPASFDVGTTTPGCIHIVSANNTNFGPGATSGTLLYQNMSGNVSLETKLSATPANGVEKTGILLYNNDSNWMALKYQVDGGGPYVEVGVQDPSGFANQFYTTVTADPIWLRLVKDGLKLTTFYSSDGVNWTEQYNFTQFFADPFMGGLLVSDGYALSNFSVDFDYFHLRLPNRPPGIAKPFLPLTFNEDARCALNVSDHFFDPEGDNLTYKVEAPHIKGGFNPAVNDVEIFGPPNWFGSEKVRITAADVDGLSIQAQLNVTVIPVEDPPILNRSLPNVMVSQNGTNSSLDLSKYIIDNDTIYGDRLAWAFSGNGSIGVSIGPSGVVTFTAPIDFWGVVNMTFTATDNASLVASGICKVTVVHVNQAPQVKAGPPDLSVNEDEAVSMDFAPVFWDPDGDPVTLSYSDNIQIDVIQTDDALEFTFKPRPDASGFSENIRFTAKDDMGLGSNFVVVKVTVIPVNDPPRITHYDPPTEASVNENQSVQFNVSAIDPDSGTKLNYTWYLDGRPAFFGATEYVYRPDFTSAGDHAVLVSVGDGELFATKGWNLTVENVDREPTDIRIVTPKAGDIFKNGTSVAFEGSAQDADGEALAYTWYEGFRELGKGRTLSLMLPAGDHAVVLQVSDGIVEVGSQQLHFTVKANAAPQLFLLDPFNGQRFQKGTRINFKAEAGDADDDPLTYSWTERGRTLSTSPSFSMSDLPAGSHVIHLTISDGKAAIDTNLTIEITQPPADSSGPGLIAAFGGIGAAVIAAVTAFILLRKKRPPAVEATRVEASLDGPGQ